MKYNYHLVHQYDVALLGLKTVEYRFTSPHTHEDLSTNIAEVMETLGADYQEEDKWELVTDDEPVPNIILEGVPI